jgi:hypothetical protein
MQELRSKIVIAIQRFTRRQGSNHLGTVLRRFRRKQIHVYVLKLDARDVGRFLLELQVKSAEIRSLRFE